MIVNVRVVEAGTDPGHYQPVPTRPGEVDLCELSKDYFGTLQKRLGVRFSDRTELYRLRFLLQDRYSNRVESADGDLLCALRLPPSVTAGLRFEPPRDGLEYRTGILAGFDFDEQDALHRIGGGDCQLRHPVGHYDLDVLK